MVVQTRQDICENRIDQKATHFTKGALIIFGLLNLFDIVYTATFLDQTTELNWYKVILSKPVLFIEVHILISLLVLKILQAIHKEYLLSIINFGMFAVAIWNITMLLR
jgi:cytochrome b